MRSSFTAFAAVVLVAVTGCNNANEHAEASSWSSPARAALAQAPRMTAASTSTDKAEAPAALAGQDDATALSRPAPAAKPRRTSLHKAATKAPAAATPSTMDSGPTPAASLKEEPARLAADDGL